MARKQNSYTRALSDAKKALKSATLENARLEARLRELRIAIPALQATVAALQRQIEPSRHDVVFHNSKTGEASLPDGTPLSTADLAKLAGPQDLSGMGSIPAREPTEDELLPEPEGEALTED